MPASIADSILFITWNATVWGVVFGYVAKYSAASAGGNPFLVFGLCLLPFLPHMITEALAYFTAAISGGVLSKAVLREDLFSEKFHHVMTDALIILGIGLLIVIIAAVIEVDLYPLLASFSSMC